LKREKMGRMGTSTSIVHVFDSEWCAEEVLLVDP